MPTNIVRTKADERLWKRAKARAAAEGQAENYAYVTAIYQRMRAGSVDKAFRDAYGSPSADWFRSIHRQTGAPLDELHKARRRGRALAPDGMPERASEYIEVCRVALEKAQTAPRGYSPLPRSKRGGYRKRVGGKWRYWYPGRLQVSVDGSLPDEIRDDAASSGVVERVGVVRSDMSLDEVETAIRDADLEHLVTFRGGEQIHRARGTENRVRADPFEVREWRESGDCLLTHNHPSGTCLSDSDILLAVGADLEEIRAVTPSGGVFSMVRPSQGWGRAGGLSGAEVKAFLRAAYVRTARRTASRMDEIVRAAGGDPEDGLEAKGYDDKEWQRLWSQHSEEEYQREFRSQGLGWSIEHHGPRHHSLDDDGARPGGDSGVPAPVEKGGFRRLLAGVGFRPPPSFARVIAKAASKPPPGYTPTPGSKLGSYRRRVRGGYEYWTPPKAGVAAAAQQDLFSAPEKTAERRGARGARVPLHYASGSNRAPDIRAFASIRQPIGLEVSKLSDASFEALEDSVADRDIPVFLDSGAFNEMGGDEITPAEWDRRLSLYDRAARLLGDQLVVVAPDKVADQDQTLARMREYAERVYDLTAFGTRVLVPLQGGDRTLAEFAPQAYEALGAEIDKDSDLYVPAFPMKKAPVPIDQIEEFLGLYQPARVHFLGLGPSTKLKTPDGVPMLQAIQEAVREHSPGTLVTLDSNLIRSAVGKDRGPKGSRFTVAQERSRELVAELSGPETVSGAMLPAYTEPVMNAMGAPHLAFSRPQLRRIGKKAGLKGQELSRWSRAPHRYTASSDAQDAALTRELEAEAVRLYLDKPTTDARKILAVQQAFGPEPGLFRSLLQTVTLRKASKPPPGYTPIPGGKHGGYRKKVGGKWVRWYPQQLGLFDQPKKAPKPKKKTREEIHRARLNELLEGTVRNEVRNASTLIWNRVDEKLRVLDKSAVEALDNIVFGAPLGVSDADNPLLSALEDLARAEVKLSGVHGGGLYPQAGDDLRVYDWFQYELSNLLSYHPKVTSEDLNEVRAQFAEVEAEYLQRFLRDGVVDVREMARIVIADIADASAILSEDVANAAEEFYDEPRDSVSHLPDRLRELTTVRLAEVLATRDYKAAEAALKSRELALRILEVNPGLQDEKVPGTALGLIRDALLEAYPTTMVSSLRRKFYHSETLGHWGTATSSNRIARETTVLGDEGRFRPLNLGMKLTPVSSVTDDEGVVDPILTIIDEDLEVRAIRRYLFAQKKMRQFPASEYPVMYRGMALPRDLLKSATAGTRLKLTGCTAFAFEHSTAVHYSTSSWTSDKSEKGAQPVLVELRRTAEFDETVAGWHPDKRQAQTRPAFEIVSGANALEIDEVVRHTEAQGLARLLGVDFNPEDSKVIEQTNLITGEPFDALDESAIIDKIKDKVGDYNFLFDGSVESAEKAGFSAEQLKGVTSIRIGDYAPGHPGELYRDPESIEIWRYRGSDEMYVPYPGRVVKSDETGWIKTENVFWNLVRVATQPYTLIRGRGVLDDV